MGLQIPDFVLLSFTAKQMIIDCINRSRNAISPPTNGLLLTGRSVCGIPTKMEGNTLSRDKTQKLILCALFTALIAGGAFIRIPIPIVPFTLQFLFTTLAGILLGGKLGCASVTIYILMGLFGLPVFAQGGGLAYILKPSFGYIIGFAVAAYVTGTISNKVSNPSYKRLLSASFTGLFIVYSFGMAYYYLISYFYLGNPIGLWSLFLYCFILAVPGDIVLCIIGSHLGKRLLPFSQKNRM